MYCIMFRHSGGSEKAVKAQTVILKFQALVVKGHDSSSSFIGWKHFKTNFLNIVNVVSKGKHSIFFANIPYVSIC